MDTIGSAWFSGEEHAQGRIEPGQYADFAILSDGYLSVPDEQIRTIESVLTVARGDVVYSAPPFAMFTSDPLPPVSPWMVACCAIRRLSTADGTARSKSKRC